ncbi:hypothetical protein Taro_017206 [Colocasia esculenta]|uniref:Aminotransferase-like plant mobile domain-containing protein n=1 Tax=Colocasia esculenta TaxID=4460 RepID=A0A843UMY7_COLES|nr:hypothetical protein [Colocasia esculenta]
MEGEQGGEGGSRRWKKSVWRQKAGEGTSTAAPDPPPVVPMEEEIAPAVGDEDEPVGHKKVGSRTLNFEYGSELRSRLGWAVIQAIYDGLPDFQVLRLEGMGFMPFLRLEELAPDVALIQVLKERWDPECHAFLFPWGHMVPTLEDVVRITGLCVDGQAVTETTYTSYQELVERLLGLAVRGERSSLVQRTVLQASLGVASARRQTGEGQVEYMGQLTEDARAAMAEEEGDAADMDLRRFMTLVIGKLILGTKGDPVGCRCLPLLEDLSSVGNYAWGAALLAHLFDSLGTSSRETGVAGFFRLLQVWAYYHLPSLGRGVARRRGAVRVLELAGVVWRSSWWLESRRSSIPSSSSSPVHLLRPAETTLLKLIKDKRSLRRQVTLIHDTLHTIPFGHVQLTPYVGEDDATQPWVERGRPYFGRDIWLHCFNTVVSLHHRLVAQTLGLHQAVVEFPTRQRPWERPGRSFRGIQQVTDWTVRLDPEGRISSLEGILHSTIQQQDDLQVVVDQLQAELDRAQQMVGGASSSREDPGRSVMEGRLASAVARAEDALAQLWERELRTALARTTTLEVEMAELRLRPKAAEVARWCQEAEAAARWQQEATEVARWRHEVEEAARLRIEAGDLRTQLGEERHRSDMLRSEMKGLERARALVGRSRSVTSRSGIPSGSAGHYLTGSSRRQRNEEEERRRRERVPEGSETGPRAMAPPSPHLLEGTGESG